MQKTKICTICKKRKLAKYFPITTDKAGRKYLGSWCRDCVNNRQRISRGTTTRKAKDKLDNIKWRKANPARSKLIQARNAAKRYGYAPPDITVKELDLMLASHDGQCDIKKCLRLGTHLDHNHSTGRVRGLICKQHNAGMGQCGDTLKALRLVVAYLKRTDT